MLKPSEHYAHIAGQNPGRLAALSDGVFAVAMTILVLDFHVPPVKSLLNDAQLWVALEPLLPRLVIYFLSFLTLGIFWVGQQTQLNFFARTDRMLSWIHLAFLSIVSLMPFVTALMADYVGREPALIVYWFTILMLGFILLVSWRYARRAGLIDPAQDSDLLNRAIQSRIIVAQFLYATGALLSLISPWLGLAIIILLQFYFAFGSPIAARVAFRDTSLK